ncbi:glycerol-3-phosphate dehydrogenase [Sphingomonas sp. MG17]|uniref:Glycerol-3-phosphate dehydrogenase n=1 Tax=Sphingomonas tagetis TaxID=2949092 RepID=A0A9X2HPN3_9SPHN|nr:glycerol-3-phosphate dehydrogenase [Sphingomonas tagetis]MCP3732246.1 glycerol-3-phosphate dehydrogenase [Sphingomonas tagetis]
MQCDVDLLIVGGGINGAGIARDAAGRGLSVALVEQDDLANHTSSASTKLIHGGLRYLEYGEVRLVRKALIEREVLWSMAPHIIWPLRFVLPQTNSPRPAWMVRLGLLLYDNLGGRKRLPGTETIRLGDDPRGKGLKPSRGDRAYVYSDCWVDDSRLVVLNARDAADRGAQVMTRTRLIEASRDHSSWTARIEDADGVRVITSRALVNAGGPWVSDVLARTTGGDQLSPRRGVRLVKGSHIVVPRLYDGDHAFMLQNPDRRIVFAIPYEGEFTLVGTTDEAWDEPPGRAKISNDEIDYLLKTINRYFQRHTSCEEVAWTYAGIRPLFDDQAANASAVTRDYVLDLDTGRASVPGAPMLSVFGGKITTYRLLAEQALAALAPFFPGARPAWTRGVALPGGDIPEGDFDAYLRSLVLRYPHLDAGLLRRMTRSHGTRAPLLLGETEYVSDLGQDFGGGVYAREVDYLSDHEWAQSGEDILFRRTKCGLHAPKGAAASIDAYLSDRCGARSGPAWSATGVEFEEG